MMPVIGQQALISIIVHLAFIAVTWWTLQAVRIDVLLNRTGSSKGGFCTFCSRSPSARPSRIFSLTIWRGRPICRICSAIEENGGERARKQGYASSCCLTSWLAMVLSRSLPRWRSETYASDRRISSVDAPSFAFSCPPYT